MLCQEIMKEDVECISPEDRVQSAARKMRDANVGFLPVCDPQKKVVGTLTDRDIVIRLVAENGGGETRVGDVMSHEVVAVAPTDTIDEAARFMREHHKSRILCLDDEGKVRGVISLSDLAQHDRSGAAETMREVSERESHLGHMRM
jgi:CBS domain-containing protein